MLRMQLAAPIERVLADALVDLAVAWDRLVLRVSGEVGFQGEGLEDEVVPLEGCGQRA